MEQWENNEYIQEIGDYMGINKACKIFGIVSLIGIDKLQIKREYKRLMIKYHPDNCGDENKAKEISEAYDILVREIDKQEKIKTEYGKVRERQIEVVKIKEVMDAHRAKDIEAIKNYRDKDTFVEFNIDVIFGDTERYGVCNRGISKEVRYNRYGKYKVCIDVEVPAEYVGDCNVLVYVLGKEYRTDMKVSIKILNIKLDERTELQLQINKKIVRSERNG